VTALSEHGTTRRCRTADHVRDVRGGEVGAWGALNWRRTKPLDFLAAPNRAESTSASRKVNR
jgi:hypothetical protein